MTLDYDLRQHDVRLMVGDPIAQAYEWIRTYANTLNKRFAGEEEFCPEVVSPDEMIETAMLNVYDHGPGTGTYLNKGELLRGISPDPMFWDKLEVLQQIEIPQSRRKNFFQTYRRGPP